jgi:hypothetical protein
MATRLYQTNPQDAMFQIVEGAGLATTKRIELTVDWDTMASTDLLSGQQARMQVVNALYRMIEYIEQTGKFVVRA